MFLLGIDTATNSGGVALSRNGEVIGMWVCKTPLRYSERLIEWIDRMLSEHSLTPGDLDALAIATGPGSFTGIRVGLATVKGLAQALGKPVLGVGTLEALAYRFRWASERVAPVIDARRQQVFGALYRIEGLHLKEESAPAVLRPAEWLKRLPDHRCLFVGDGAEFYHTTIESLRPADRVFASGNRLVDSLCRLAYFRYTRGQAVRPQQLQALYVRPSDAELGRSGSFAQRRKGAKDPTWL